MAATLFVTGGSGFVGSAVLDELVSRGYSAHALVSKKPIADRGGKVTSFTSDLFDAAALDHAIAGCDAAIHLVGIIREKPSARMTFDRIHNQGTRAVVDAARRAGLKRYVHMSALGARPHADSEYHKSKWEGEESVRASGLNWTIFRPSMIHGPHGEFMKMEAAWAKKQQMPFLFMPYFGSGLLGLGGSGKIQPIYVGDIARAFVDSIEKPATVRQTYDLVGPDVMDWPTMHKMVASVLTGKNRATMPIPAWYAKAIANIAPAAWLPFNRAQVIMSQEDNVADIAPAEIAFGWKPRSFAATLTAYKDQL